MRIRIYLICAAVIIASACGNNRKAEQFKALPFPEIVPPAMMEDPMDRAEYMAVNMWNSLLDPSRDFPSDSLHVSGVRMGDVE